MTMQYILVVRNGSHRITHLSAHATREEAEKKALAIGAKSRCDLFAHVYSAPVAQGSAPADWRLETCIAL